MDNILFSLPHIDGRCIAIVDDWFRDREIPGLDCTRIYIKAAEEFKTLATVEQIYRKLLDLHADRNTFLIGIGGGITTDITGFVAATFKRGLHFGLIPTTLLAQVDAAIGGKNGVNLDRYKNMVGTFRIADWIYICPDFTLSLPRRQMLCGAAEMLKAFILADKDAYSEGVRVFSSHSEVIRVPAELTGRAIDIKRSLVEQDPEDHGVRHLLNLGHTFGHAIEKCSTSFLHGEAVAIGTVMAAKLSCRLGMLSETEARMIENDFRSIGLPVESGIPAEALVEAMAQDKKKNGETIRYVLPTSIGSASIWESSATV